MGRIWRSQENFKFRDFDMSVGAGLRLHLGRFASSKVLRIDFSYSRQFDWEISVGTGQFFRTNLNRLLLTNLWYAIDYKENRFSLLSRKVFLWAKNGIIKAVPSIFWKLIEFISHLFLIIVCRQKNVLFIWFLHADIV